MKKDGLAELARDVQRKLRDAGFIVFYDEGGSIGRRYRRIDEIGVALGITIDYDSKKNRDVTIRDRDTMDQVRVKIDKLPEAIMSFMLGENLNKLGVALK